MNYGQIYDCDTANGIGLRVSLFVSGCTHHCLGCFNEETWDFHYGLPYTQKTQKELIEKLSRPYIRGLTLIGGEPCEPCNQRELQPLLMEVKLLMPSKDIWCYSGYCFEELAFDSGSRCRCEVTDDFLSYIDVLVDGEFVLEKKDISLLFRGSSNQRLLDLPESIRAGTPVLWSPKCSE